MLLRGHTGWCSLRGWAVPILAHPPRRSGAAPIRSRNAADPPRRPWPTCVTTRMARSRPRTSADRLVSGVPNRPQWTTSSAARLPGFSDGLFGPGPRTRAPRRRRSCAPAGSRTPRAPRRGTPARTPKNSAAQAVVGGRQQHQQRRHARVDVPVGHRPAGLAPVGPALVGCGVALEVGVPVGAADDERGRGLHAAEPVRLLLFLLVGRRPEPLAVLRRGQHDEVPALAEPGARSAAGVVEDRRQHVLGTGRSGS